MLEYAPQLAESFKTNKKSVGGSWRTEETYVTVKDDWMYQYRTVNKDGNTVDCYFSKNRDKSAATKLFIKSMLSSGKSVKVNIGKSGGNTAVLTDINYYVPK